MEVSLSILELFGVGAAMSSFTVGVGVLLSKLIENYIKQAYQAKFDRKKIEFESKFVRLHEKRMLVIAELYSLLRDTQCLLNQFAVSIKKDDDTSSKMSESIQRLNFYFMRNKIYLPESTADLANQIRIKLDRTSHDMLSQKEVFLMSDFYTVLFDEMGELFDQLEKDFRGSLEPEI
ncbi:hypothetical protein [Vibrio aestuarianus]|uniref:hypothetical protein n=1 Tax=Vibrio aestuarianus TaxID=28171 RepID=UPI00237C9A90|nr:hypothetical protein [Vibrio aestuarianus]MDE1211987.1 hypothetical protein [Vibrio aestuarianus]